MDTRILFKQQAQESLFAGIEELTEAVASTLGPNGHTVIIDKGYGIPHITKDGVTVARAYDTNDSIKRMGATLVKTVAAKTCDEAGDGTTTATILTYALIKEGMKKMHFVKNPQDFKRGIEYATQCAVEFIESKSQKIAVDDFDKIRQIATVSANGDEEIGYLIKEAITKVGNDGVITVEESAKGVETSIEVSTGFQWEKGLVNPYFVTDPERIEAVLDKPYVLVFGQNVNYVQEIMAIVQSVYTMKRSLLIVAPNMSNDVVKFLVMNVQQTNGLKACFVKAPGYGQIQKDLLMDLAVKIGAQVIGDEYGHPVTEAGTDWLGECDRAVVSSTRTVLVGGAGSEEEVNIRVAAIKSQIDSFTNSFDIEKCRERIAKLTGGAAIIYVGGNSEVETKERKDRVDDAIAATRAAIDEGYIPGGATVHFRAALVVKKEAINTSTDFNMGMEVVAEALFAPFRQLCVNSGINADKISIAVENAPEWFFGLNPVSGEVIDLFEAEVLDPAKVSRVSLENAVSVATQFLNTYCVMAADEEPKK